MGAQQSTACCQWPSRDESTIEGLCDNRRRHYWQENFTEIAVMCGCQESPDTEVPGGEALPAPLHPAARPAGDARVRTSDASARGRGAVASACHPARGSGSSGLQTRRPEAQRASPGTAAAPVGEAEGFSATPRAPLEAPSPEAPRIAPELARSDEYSPGGNRSQSNANRRSLPASKAPLPGVPSDADPAVAAVGSIEYSDKGAARAYLARCTTKAYKKTCRSQRHGNGEAEQWAMDAAKRRFKGSLDSADKPCDDGEHPNWDALPEVCPDESCKSPSVLVDAPATPSRGNSFDAASAASVLAGNGLSVSSSRRTPGERKGKPGRRGDSSANSGDATTPGTNPDSDQESPHTSRDQELCSYTCSVGGVNDTIWDSQAHDDGGKDALEEALRSLGVEKVSLVNQIMATLPVNTTSSSAAASRDALPQKSCSVPISHVQGIASRYEAAPAPAPKESSIRTFLAPSSLVPAAKDSLGTREKVADEAEAWRLEEDARAEFEMAQASANDSPGIQEQLAEEAKAWRLEEEAQAELKMAQDLTNVLTAISKCDDVPPGKIMAAGKSYELSEELDFTVLVSDEHQAQVGLNVSDSIHKPRSFAARASFGTREKPRGPPTVLHPGASQLVSAPMPIPCGGDARARVMSADESRRGSTMEQAVRAGLEHQRRSAWHPGHHSGLGAHVVGAALGALVASRSGTRPRGPLSPRFTNAAPAGGPASALVSSRRRTRNSTGH